MKNKVIDNIIKKCRKAMLSGIPIVYINTDSDILIKSIVESEDSPLVTLVSSNSGGAIYNGRPYSELKAHSKSIGKRAPLDYTQNYKNSLPRNTTTLNYPHIWTYKMPDSEYADMTDIIKTLEEYVCNHEDPEYVCYDYLQSSIVILYSTTVKISPMLHTYTEFIDVELPDEKEIKDIILENCKSDDSLINNNEYMSAVCTDFLGFSTEEISATLKKINAVSSWANPEEAEKIIIERKQQKLRGGMLEQCQAKGEIGGMANFKDWLTEQADSLKNSNLYKQKVGTPPPKGVLMCGIPGCGKSEAAKFTAQTLNLPLLKLDMGKIMDKYQGESERKMREALTLAETMSPCVLWIDELEKGFSAAGSDSDSSSFKRMFAYMLGWMQDNKEPCFIFATANSIGGLPKEFFRSGRFDALFAVYLPMADECVSIFRECMKKNIRAIAESRHISEEDVKLFSDDCFEYGLLNKITNITLVPKENKPRIVIGADIQKIVNTALKDFVKKGYPIKGEDWLNALKAAAQTCQIYGDSEENIDSIAISYCRMLRKGFKPTSDTFFEAENYKIENFEKLSELKRTPTYSMTEDQRREHDEKLKEYAILKEDYPAEPVYNRFMYIYDVAVYNLLHQRINSVAFEVEQIERDKILRS